MKHHLVAAAIALCSQPVEAGWADQGQGQQGSANPPTVYDARNKLVGTYLPAQSSVGGTVVINLANTPNVFALTTRADTNLLGPELFVEYIIAYTQPDCAGQPYIFADEALPQGWFDGTYLWFASRPLERQAIKSEDFSGSCFNLDAIDSTAFAHELVGKAATVLNKFKAPFTVR
jgi:hypothetical protein